MEKNRIHTKSFGLSRADIERYLIEKYDFPEDIVITGFTKSPNAAGYIVELHSPHFPAANNELEQSETSTLKDGYKYV